MKSLRIFLVVSSLFSPVAFAQQAEDHSSTLVAAIGTTENQWVFNHICVPVEALPGKEYTNRDFVDAYFSITQTRWAAALAAKAKGDERGSMKELAKILHGVIDAYWPGRLERDASGAIVAFKDCKSLGNLPGVLSVEKLAGPDSETQKKQVQLISEVIKRWRDARPFDEVKTVLASGPMNLSPAFADSLLVKQP
jgi:hypothetical protein